MSSDRYGGEDPTALTEGTTVYLVLKLVGGWDGEVGETLDLEGSDAILIAKLSQYP